MKYLYNLKLSVKDINNIKEVLLLYSQFQYFTRRKGKK